MTTPYASTEEMIVQGSPAIFGAHEDFSHYPPYEIPAYLCEDAPTSDNEQSVNEVEATFDELDQSFGRPAFNSIKFSIPAFGTRAYLRSFWLKKKQYRSDLKPFEEPETETEEESASFEKVSFAGTTTVIVYDELHYTEHRESLEAPATPLKRAISKTNNPNKFEEMFLCSNQKYCDKITKEGLCAEDETRPAVHNESYYRQMLLQAEEDDEEEDEEETQKYIQRMQAIHKYNLMIQEEKNIEDMERLGLPNSASLWADME